MWAQSHAAPFFTASSSGVVPEWHKERYKYDIYHWFGMLLQGLVANTHSSLYAYCGAAFSDAVFKLQAGERVDFRAEISAHGAKRSRGPQPAPRYQYERASGALCRMISLLPYCMYVQVYYDLYSNLYGFEYEIYCAKEILA